jgi:hypothetical protein
MIKLQITESQIERAKKLFSFNKLKNSIKEGEGNLLGAIGEIVAFDYYQEQDKLVIHSGDFNFDLLIDGSKIEVKTMEVNATPKEYHECNVSLYNAEQQCDYYLFLNVDSSHSTAYIKGYVSKERFKKIRQLRLKGEKNGSFEYKCDTFVVLNSQLS